MTVDVNEEKIRECARRAADLLLQPGVWGQGDDKCGSSTGNGMNECATTAAYRSAAGSLARDRMALASIVDGRVARLLGLSAEARGSQHDPTFTYAVILWNDTPGRTVDEVVAVLERVAAGEGGPGQVDGQ